MDKNLLLYGGAGIAVLVVIALGLLITMALRRVVDTNMVHIVQAGKKTTSYGKGREAGNVYYEIPSFIPMFGVTVSKLPISNFPISLDNYPAYDLGRLPFRVDVRAFLVIFDSDKAAERVSSFEQLKADLGEILKGAVRRVLSEHKLEEILGMRSELAKTFTEEVQEQLKEWGVRTVKVIEFMDMRDDADSTVIHDIQAKDKSRINQESRIKVAENERIAEQAEIEATRSVDISKQDAIEKVGIREAEVAQTIGSAKELSNQKILEQQAITTEKQMEVQRVNDTKTAEINKSVAIIQAEEQQRVAEVKANQDKQVTIIGADAEKQRVTTLATAEKERLETESAGQLTAATNEAKGIEAKGMAEGKAKEAVLLAEVTPQITLAKEIGENGPYQTYLVSVEQIKANKDVGVANAQALGNAQIKVVVTGGSAQDGMSNVLDLVSPKGGALVGAAIEAFQATTDKSPTEAAADVAEAVTKGRPAKSAPSK